MHIAPSRSENMKRIIFFVLLISTLMVACTALSDSEPLMVDEDQYTLGYEEFLTENGLLVMKMNKMLDEEHYRLRNVKFLNENELLVMKQNKESGGTKKIELVDINSGTVKQIYEGEFSEDPGNHLSILDTNDNNILISGYEAALVISRDKAVFDEIKFERNIWANAFLPDGNLLCFDNGEVYLFDLNSRQIQHLFEIKPDQGLVNCWFRINSDGTEALFITAKENYEIDVYKIDLLTRSFRLLNGKGSTAFWENENILLVQTGTISKYPVKLEIINQDDEVIAAKNYSSEERIKILDIAEDLILVYVTDRSATSTYLQILDSNLNEIYKISDSGYVHSGTICSSNRKIAYMVNSSLFIINLDTQNKN